MSKIIIIGATSAIASACARLWASQGATFHLVARRRDRLAQVEQDLRARGAAQVTSHVLDVRDRAALAEALAAACSDGVAVDVALVAHGTLPDQAKTQMDAAYAAEAFDVNATATIAAIAMLAQSMERQRAGTIAVISSVAGDRGRPSNHLYGAAKGAVSLYCEGLRGRLHGAGVNVLTIKPGFVDTPMTSGLSLPRALVASADQVALGIMRGIASRRGVVYVPGWWSIIMLVIRNIPSVLYVRLKL